MLMGMDYERAAHKLITYSRAFAHGSLSHAYGLSVGEAPVLEHLSTQGASSPSDLASGLGYTRSRMSRILDSLQAKGYVERTTDERDRRRVIVRATQKGCSHSARRRSEGVSELAETLEGMGEHDVSELVRVLERAYRITYNEDPPECDDDAR